LDLVWGFEKNKNHSSNGSFFLSTSFIKMFNDLFSFRNNYSIFFPTITIFLLKLAKKKNKPNNIKDITQEEAFKRLQN
jgi:hypothetical protein